MSEAEIFQIERAKGSSIGATIMGGFGAVWLVLGMMAAGLPAKIGLVIVLPVFALIAGLGSLVRRRLPKLPDVGLPDMETMKKRQMMRAFSMVNIAEWMAIFGAVNLLRNLHLDTWVISSIVLIVGAHFIPLARIFRSRSHLITGLVMIVCAVTAVVMPVSIRDMVECLAAGLTLWASAGAGLYAGFRAASRVMTPSVMTSQASA